jgi:hypothetical protein
VLVTHRPLGSNHPSAPNDFPILPHSSEGISWILESQFEAIGNLRMRRGVGGLALSRERPKVLYRSGVLIGRIAEYDNI